MQSLLFFLMLVRVLCTHIHFLWYCNVIWVVKEFWEEDVGTGCGFSWTPFSCSCSTFTPLYLLLLLLIFQVIIEGWMNECAWRWCLLYLWLQASSWGKEEEDGKNVKAKESFKTLLLSPSSPFDINFFIGTGEEEEEGEGKRVLHWNEVCASCFSFSHSRDSFRRLIQETSDDWCL